MTKDERHMRRYRCIAYLRAHSTLDAARKAAAKDGFCANTSVWIGAYSQLLQAGGKPGDRKKGDL